MRVAFASCAKIQDRDEQPVWTAIRAAEPDVLLLLGDNVYAGGNPETPGELRRKLNKRYDAQLTEPHFAALLAYMRSGKRKVAAIWDDHDFAGDDSYGLGLTDAMRRTAREIFHVRLSALTNSNGASNDPQREVYHRFVHEHATFLMLDTRFHRQPPADPPSTDVDAMLGREQRIWLERCLEEVQTAYTVVCSGTPLNQHQGAQTEHWTQYPAARDWLVQRLRHRRGAIFLAGDIHRNAFSDADGVLEAISSGVGRHSRFAGRVLANYGLIDLDPFVAQIHLRGNRPGDEQTRRIERANWTP